MDAEKKRKGSGEELIGIFVFPRRRVEEAEHAEPERVSGECYFLRKLANVASSSLAR
jgi:hypothetical protein